MWPFIKKKKTELAPQEPRITVTRSGIEISDEKETSFTPLSSIAGVTKREGYIGIHNVNSSMTLYIRHVDVEELYTEILAVFPNAS